MTIWLIADTHFSHTATIFKFQEPDGSFMRGEFADVDPEVATQRMDDRIVDGINSVVKSSDHLYIIGDVSMRRSGLQQVKRLASKHKTLIGGNHDVFKLNDYLNVGFKEVRGTRVLSHVVMTHIPIHPMSMSRFIGNVHGHIHRAPSPPGPYLNVGVEALNYTPITLEEAVMRLALLNPDKRVAVEEIDRMATASEEIELLVAGE